MKRIFALIISLMLVTCLLAACGDDDTYRQPGTGTTLGGKVTTPAVDDQNGSYSADPDGEVNQTTENGNIIENGVDDIENGLNEGMNDLEQGINDLENGADEMLGGNNGDVTGDVQLNENLPEAQHVDENTDIEGIAGPSEPMGADAENNNNNNAGNTNGATNGNSH